MADESNDITPEPQEVPSVVEDASVEPEATVGAEPAAPAEPAEPAPGPASEPEVVVAEATVAEPLAPPTHVAPETAAPEAAPPATYAPPPPPPAPGYAPPPPAPAPTAASAKSKVAAGVFGILLGSLGIHKFYLGYNKEGLIMLLVTLLTFGFLAWATSIVGLVEGIIYLTKTDDDFEATYVVGRKPWF